MTGGAAVAVVTGGLGGIGTAIADGLAGRGDRVVVADLPGRGRGASPHAFVPLDVRDPASVSATFARIESEFGDIEILVNCAGVMARTSAIETSFEIWSRVIDVNLTGTFLCSVAAAQVMAARGRGFILNIGSIWAQHVWPNRAAYSASKAAVEQFTRCLAREVAERGVSVTCLSPGLIDTDFTQSVMNDPVFQREFMPRISVGRAGLPSRDLVEPALLLTSAASSYMAGSVVNVHGGYY